MKSPYVRLRELSGIGQREFERKYELSHTVMVNIESGMYPDLSEYMIQALGRECAEKGVDARGILKTEYHSNSLQEAYHFWQLLMRKLAEPMLREIDQALIERRVRTTPELSPMHFLVKQMAGSLRSFCVTFKVPAPTVARYLVGKTRTMPKALEEAFNQAGMSKETLAWLKDQQELWMVEHA